ncbi:hypothetical protein DNTS_029149, partial [Danionella cerebrum]
CSHAPPTNLDCSSLEYLAVTGLSKPKLSKSGQVFISLVHSASTQWKDALYGHHSTGPQLSCYSQQKNSFYFKR